MVLCSPRRVTHLLCRDELAMGDRDGSPIRYVVDYRVFVVPDCLVCGPLECNLDKLYKLYSGDVFSVTLSQFRNRQSEYIAVAQREPVEIISRGVGRRAVVVSPEFFDRALQALEDQADILGAAEARSEAGRVSHAELERKLGS